MKHTLHKKIENYFIKEYSERMLNICGADLGFVMSVALTDNFPKNILYKEVLKTWKPLLVADN